jgi:hypothetical protein
MNQLYQKGQEVFIGVSIAIAQAKMGQAEAARRVLEDALATASMIPQPVRRSQALAEIAAFQAEAGQTEEARRTAARFSAGVDRHLPRVAEVFAQANNKAGVLRLMVPCASYLDATYTMCGLLAQIFPEQASRIAAVMQGEASEQP